MSAWQRSYFILHIVLLSCPIPHTAALDKGRRTAAARNEAHYEHTPQRRLLARTSAPYNTFQATQHHHHHHHPAPNTTETQQQHNTTATAAAQVVSLEAAQHHVHTHTHAHPSAANTTQGTTDTQGVHAGGILDPNMILGNATHAAAGGSGGGGFIGNHTSSSSNNSTGAVNTDEEEVPEDFVWHQYLKMYPELVEHLGVDETHAKLHYRGAGKSEGRAHRLPPMYLQYTACTNLFEQLYSHMAALALASQLHAQPIMPPALTKDEQGKWAPVPLQTILNFKRTRKNAQGMGLQLHVVPSEMYGYLPTETLWHGSTDELNRASSGTYNPDACHPQWRWEDVPDDHVLHFEGVYEATRSLDSIVKHIHSRVGQLAVQLFKANRRAAGQPLHPIILNLPCTFFAVHALSSLVPLQQVAGVLAFPRPLIQVAANAIKLMQDELRVEQFNGVMLRGHDDWLTLTSTQFPTIYFKYIKAMEATFGTTPLPCYFGVEDLIDITAQGIDALEHNLVQANKSCSAVLTRFSLVDDEDLQGMHAEQYKLLDILILLEAQGVVTHYKSLGGLFLNEYRHLVHRGAKRMTRVQTQIIVDRLPREFDRLIMGGLFTTRHAQTVQDLPTLYIGDGQAKMDALLKKKRAERLQKLTDEERQRIGLPPRNTTLTDEQRAALPEDYAEAL